MVYIVNLFNVFFLNKLKCCKQQKLISNKKQLSSFMIKPFVYTSIFFSVYEVDFLRQNSILFLNSFCVLFLRCAFFIANSSKVFAEFFSYFKCSNRHKFDIFSHIWFIIKHGQGTFCRLYISPVNPNNPHLFQ
jgi:hypothetical protein